MKLTWVSILLIFGWGLAIGAHLMFRHMKSMIEKEDQKRKAGGK